MIRIAVLYGGVSSEHEVSLISAASILSHLDRDKYSILPIGIARSGFWYLQALPDWVFMPAQQEAMRPLPSIEASRRVLAMPGDGLWAEGPRGFEKLAVDIVFPVLHGTFGEDGTIQGLLEICGLPYVGAGVLGSAIGMDKDVSKRLWLEAGLPVVNYLRASQLDVETRMTSLAAEVSSRLGYPCFVKPACSGSSVGTAKVTDPEMLEGALREALRWSRTVLIEEFINAREIECSVLGNEHPVAFDPGEVVPHHEFYDYAAKYLDPDGAGLLVPASLAPETAEKIKRLAIKAYEAAGLEGMARVDFFIDKTNGTIYLNEVNTIPGFTAISMYPRMCMASGLSYEALLDCLVELGLERKQYSDKFHNYLLNM